MESWIEDAEFRGPQAGPLEGNQPFPAADDVIVDYYYYYSFFFLLFYLCR
jgi:hypothetical protein